MPKYRRAILRTERRSTFGWNPGSAAPRRVRAMMSSTAMHSWFWQGLCRSSVCALVIALAACGGKSNGNPMPPTSPTPPGTGEPIQPSWLHFTVSPMDVASILYITPLGAMAPCRQRSLPAGAGVRAGRGTDRNHCERAHRHPRERNVPLLDRTARARGRDRRRHTGRGRTVAWPPKVRRTGGEIDGRIDYDVDGTLAGNWFAADLPVSESASAATGSTERGSCRSRATCSRRIGSVSRLGDWG